MNEMYTKIVLKKSKLISGICFLLLGFLFFAFTVIQYCNSELEQLYILIGSIVAGLLCFIAGGVCILHYGRYRRQLTEILQRYGEQTILSNVLYMTLAVYLSKRTNEPTDFYTDSFIYHVNQFIIDYRMIDWMYPVGSIGSNRKIRIHLINGEKYDICRGISEENVAEFMKICIDHNAKISQEYSNAYRQEYRRKVQAYKNGMQPIIPMKLSLLTQPVLSKPMKKAVGGYTIVNLYYMENPTPIQRRKMAVCTEVMRNFRLSERKKAIKYYQQQTGAGRAEAKGAVEQIFATKRARNIL